MAEMAKQHGHKLEPATEPFGPFLGIVSLDQILEVHSWEFLQ
jgi:hypothetical protein